MTAPHCSILIRPGTSARGAATLEPGPAGLEVETVLLDGADARACNAGAAGATGACLVFLDGDALPHPGWLDALLDYADAHPRAGAVGARLLSPDGTIRHAGVVFGGDRLPRRVYAGFAVDHPAVVRSRRFAAVAGGCVLVRREAFAEAGGFDPELDDGYADVDLCLRLGELGWESHLCAESVVTQLEPATRPGERERELGRPFLDRWGDSVKPDDLALYRADGLLRFEHAIHTPHRLTVDPALAGVDTEERSRDGLPLLDRQAARVSALLRRRTELESERRRAIRPQPLIHRAWPYCRPLERSFRDGVTARAQGAPPLAEDAVRATIASLVAADWSAIDGKGLSAADAESQAISAALLRTAEVVGRWIGENSDRVPRALVDGLRASGNVDVNAPVDREMSLARTAETGDGAGRRRGAPVVVKRGRSGIIAAVRRAAPPPPASPTTDLKGAYVRHVEFVQSLMSHDEAMGVAVGGAFEAVGTIEAALLRHYGLPQDGYLIDVGCGSGRLAKPLSGWLRGPYLGIDLVPSLLEHARSLVARPDWRFEEIDHIGIPEEDGRADMVVFFSVLTHLLHEQGYWYLEEARRVLKPGGRIIFSFLDFNQPEHWAVFASTLADSKAGLDTHLNVFIDRDWLPIWAEHLDMVVEDIRSAVDAVVPEGNLGQSICVLRKPPG